MGTHIESDEDVSKIREVLQNAKIRSTADLRKAASDEKFQQTLFSALVETARRNGSTITLSGVAAWISVAVGSIGIAGMGSAIGVPLGAILIPLALLGGGFLDEEGVVIKGKRRVIGLFSKSTKDARSPTNADFAAVTEAITLISSRVDMLTEELESQKARTKRQTRWIAALAVWVALLTIALGCVAITR